jgi:hypothetical protein
MQYDDDNLSEEQSFKLSDNADDENFDDLDEVDIPEEMGTDDLESGEEETDTAY